MTPSRDNPHVTGADLPHVRWRKSTHSNNGGSCIKAAPLGPTRLVRDFKDPAGPVLTFTHAEWTTFLATIKSGSVAPE